MAGRRILGGGRTTKNLILNQLKGDEQQVSAWLLCKESPTNPEKWQQVIEDVLTIGGPKKRILLQVRREAVAASKNTTKGRGRPGWVVYVQRRYAEELSKLYGGGEEKYWTGERRLQKVWAEIVNLAVRLAYLRGLLI